MYGSYGMYSGNRSNFSSASNLYRPAGVINIQVSNIPQTGTVNGTNVGLINGKGTDGTIVGLASAPHTSITSSITEYGMASAALVTNTSYKAQHVDYGQNPSATATNNNHLNYGSDSLQGTTNQPQPQLNTINITIAMGTLVRQPGQSSIGFSYSYTAGMKLPLDGSTVTVSGVIFAEQLDNGYNGTFTVLSSATQGVIRVAVDRIPGAQSRENTGVLSFFA